VKNRLVRFSGNPISIFEDFYARLMLTAQRSIAPLRHTIRRCTCSSSSSFERPVATCHILTSLSTLSLAIQVRLIPLKWRNLREHERFLRESSHVRILARIVASRLLSNIRNDILIYHGFKESGVRFKPPNFF
jgi:hypothetical protein